MYTPSKPCYLTLRCPTLLFKGAVFKDPHVLPPGIYSSIGVHLMDVLKFVFPVILLLWNFTSFMKKVEYYISPDIPLYLYKNMY